MKQLLLPLLVFFLCAPAIAQEICNNAIDDDGDGLIDLNDTTDCNCTGGLGGSGEGNSIIPNPSFEELVPGCCPMDFSQMYCAASWEQATDATTDLINACGFLPPFVPVPLPDGQGCAGTVFINDSHEYFGVCLLSTLNAGEEYNLLFDVAAGLIDWETGDVQPPNALPATELVLYGSSNCSTFPLATSGCPLGMDDWQVLAAIPYQPVWEWQQIEMTFTPAFNTTAVMIGSPCSMPAAYNWDFVGFAPYVFWDNFVMNTSALFNSSITVTGSLCAQDLLLHTEPDTTGGSYQWFAEGIALLGQTDMNLDLSGIGLGAGTYQVQFDLDTACSLASITIPPVEPIHPLMLASDTAGCVPLEVFFNNTTLLANDSCFWNFGDGAISSGCSVSHVYNVPGTYDVTLSLVTLEGCTFDCTVIGLIHAVGPPTSGFDISPQPVFAGSGTAHLNDASSSDVVSWEWRFEDLFPYVSDEQGPEVDVPFEPGSFPIELIVTNSYGCIDTVQGTMIVVPSGDLDMPNVFSPNGDGDNDRFIPLDEFPGQANLSIYNRWGQEIYSTSSITTGWNGKVKGTDAPAGTYYYVVETIGTADPRKIVTGHIALVR